jgi:broad specificity phosphatase PhoE
LRTRLIFVRHAEAVGNKIRRFHGWTDSPITEKGHLQAQRAAERLKDMPIDVIYSSSLLRTRQTVGYIAAAKGMDVITSEDLREINGGDWEDLTWAELEQRWPEEYNTWENDPHKHRMPNGESMADFQQRLINEIIHIIRQHEGKNICIVTHGTAIRAMICYFRACTLEEMINVAWCENTAVTIIDYEDGVFKTVLEGDSSHLGKELGTVVNQEWWDDYIKKLESRRGNEGSVNGTDPGEAEKD